MDDNVAIHRDYEKVLLPRPSAGASELDALEASLFAEPSSPQPAQVEVDYDVVHAHQGEEAVRLVADTVAAGEAFAVAFVDVRMPPGIDGIETVRRIWAIDPRIEIVICSAFSDSSREEIVASVGQGDQVFFLSKPFDASDVVELARASAHRYAQRRARALEDGEPNAG